jgi:DNA-binding NarL/FixJ family response regulator
MFQDVNKRVRVLLCDDQVSIRAHVRRALANAPDMEVVGEASGGRAGVSMALELLPDLMISDVCMPDLNGIQAMKQILATAPAIRIVIFSSERSTQMAEQAFSAGACAYVVKSSNADELVRAVRVVMQGGRFVSPAIYEQPQTRTQERSRNVLSEQASNSQTQAPIRVVLVDGTVYVRERLAELLSALEGVQVVGQAADGATALRLIEEHHPDVLVMDLELPGQSGTDVLASIRKDVRGPLIIILTNCDYPVLRQTCARLGADFYFYKSVEFERVIEVCQELARRARAKGPGPD